MGKNNRDIAGRVLNLGNAEHHRANNLAENITARRSMGLLS
ncbi:hypothetical protein SAMN04487951_11284 [Vreelandella arcis]|uniref:Uncharacterized protein n=1 Tax=Vreelandella arcis TaxID=416873 RepID=A0A1H0GLC2_9GAMM|nr:hypothetical protein SAMN04487951_11284 [Halomonas arcis]